MQKRIHILGSYVDTLTMEESIVKVEKFIVSRECVQHVVINANKVILMNEDEEMKRIVNNCKLINADGQSIVWAAQILGKLIPERVTGIDLFLKLIEVSDKKGYKVFFFGAKQEVLEKVVDIFKKRYINLKIAGWRNGYFKEEESIEIAEEIKDSGTDILFVAFSSPKKEYWINKYMPIMKVPFAMGVGGSFDLVAGLTSRAPLWMQKYGLEWLYRLIQEPRRMWKRYLITNSKFILLVFKEKIAILFRLKR